MKKAKIVTRTDEGATAIITMSDGLIIRADNEAIKECGIDVMMRVYGYDISGERTPAVIDPNRFPVYQHEMRVGTLPKNYNGSADLFRTHEGWIAPPGLNVSLIPGFDDN